MSHVHMVTKNGVTSLFQLSYKSQLIDGKQENHC